MREGKRASFFGPQPRAGRDCAAGGVLDGEGNFKRWLVSARHQAVQAWRRQPGSLRKATRRHALGCDVCLEFVHALNLPRAARVRKGKLFCAQRRFWLATHVSMCEQWAISRGDRQMASFTKTSPGHACKVALSLSAEWVAPVNTIGVREAIDADGSVVAYHDCDGWFVHASYAGLDLRHIAA
jgi:hypothetical protein